MPDTTVRLLTTPAPTTFDAYRQSGGYVALQRALRELTPAQTLEEIRASNLRGRGGGGVLTAEKMALVARSGADATYLICNAYDADPRSLISRSLLRDYPHLVIEGMAIAAYAIGAAESFLYMRGDRALAATVERALREAEEHGALGRRLFGSSFSFTVTHLGADIGFMGGEESTLIQVIKGRPPKAQQRPPYPTEYGLYDKPTLVQNVETLANLPFILTRGPEAFAKTGSPAASGTKLFTIIGPAGGPGSLVELPFGATLQEALRAANVPANESSARAVVVGGLEGGALPLSQLGLTLDYEPVEDVGAIIGSSVIEIAPAGSCMVRWAMERTRLLSDETCGKCVPCRIGVKRIAATLETIVSGLGAKGDLDLLAEFSRYVPDGSLCGFGVNAVHPVVTAMKYFADDFTAHLDGHCPTGECLPVRSQRFITKHVL